jgi:hypothetical protein
MRHSALRKSGGLTEDKRVPNFTPISSSLFSIVHGLRRGIPENTIFLTGGFYPGRPTSSSTRGRRMIEGKGSRDGHR